MGSAPSKKTSPFQRKAHNFVIAVPDYSLYQINPDNSRHNMHLPGDVLCSIFRLMYAATGDIVLTLLVQFKASRNAWGRVSHGVKLSFSSRIISPLFPLEVSNRMAFTQAVLCLGLGTWVPKNHLEYSTKELSIETLNNLSTGVNWKSVVLESGLLNSSSTKPFCSAILQSKTITSLNLNSHDLGTLPIANFSADSARYCWWQRYLRINQYYDSPGDCYTPPDQFDESHNTSR